jgi:hydroxyacid-oxoacid transhydrogenase
MSNEIAFEMATSSLRFGVGVTREVGKDLVDLGVKRALVVTDPNLTRLHPSRRYRRARGGGVAVLFDRARVEPIDGSFAKPFSSRNAPDGRNRSPGRVITRPRQ